MAEPTTRAAARRPTMAPGSAVGLGVALAAAVSFGMSGPAAKAIIGAGLSPLDTVWLRLACAASVLVPYALLARRAQARRLLRDRVGYLIAYGLLALAGVQVCYFVAVSRLPVGVALLMEYLAPALVIGWHVLLRRTALPASTLVGAVMAVAGIAVVVQVWQGVRLDALGLAAGLGSAVCQAAFFVMSERAAHVGVDAVVLVAGGMLIGALAVGVVAPPWRLPWSVLGQSATVSGLVLPVWLLLAFVVLVSTVLAYAAGIAAVRLLTAPVAGVVATTEVVVAALVAWLALGERLTAAQVAGGAVVLAGALLAQTGAARRRGASRP